MDAETGGLTVARQTTLFDYQQVDPETRIVVQQRINEVKVLAKRSAQDIIEIGQKLIEIKGRLNHGQFGALLEAEFGWTEQLARQFMNVARNFGQLENETLFRFGPSALRLLAAPSITLDARQEAIERAEAGETITYTKARQIVTEHKVNGSDNHIKTCPACQQLYDGQIFQSCPYCYKADRDLTGWVDGLPETMEQEPPAESTPDNGASRYIPLLDSSRPKVLYTPSGLDACQTPGYAIDPLLRYLDSNWTIWEPAAGEGNLVEAFYDAGFSVTESDKITGQDFFEYEPENWDCLVTNPPYSLHFQWLERCYSLGKPFALLLKVDILGTKTAQNLFSQHGIEVIFLDERISFKMPYKGWDGGGAWFATAWFTWGLNIGQQMTFYRIATRNELANSDPAI